MMEVRIIIVQFKKIEPIALEFQGSFCGNLLNDNIKLTHHLSGLQIVIAMVIKYMFSQFFFLNFANYLS